MLTQERMRELLAEAHKAEHNYPSRQKGIERGIDVDIPVRTALSAMTRAVQEAVEEAAKVADAQAYDAPRGPAEAILSEGAAQIATAIRSLAPKE